jgi:hypothetical protein
MQYDLSRYQGIPSYRIVRHHRQNHFPVYILDGSVTQVTSVGSLNDERLHSLYDLEHNGEITFVIVTVRGGV